MIIISTSLSQVLFSCWNSKFVLFPPTSIVFSVILFRIFSLSASLSNFASPLFLPFSIIFFSFFFFFIFFLLLFAPRRSTEELSDCYYVCIWPTFAYKYHCNRVSIVNRLQSLMCIVYLPSYFHLSLSITLYSCLSHPFFLQLVLSHSFAQTPVHHSFAWDLTVGTSLAKPTDKTPLKNSSAVHPIYTPWENP